MGSEGGDNDCLAPLRHKPDTLGVTDRQLAMMPYPELPGRDSQRQSTSPTRGVHSRTFSGLTAWEGFREAAFSLARELDNVAGEKNGNPWRSIGRNGLEPAGSEIGVHSAMDMILFPQINDLASGLGMRLKYLSGGSGRSLSQTDLVVIDRASSQDMRDLSARVYGNGEAKGPWQWELRSGSLLEELECPKRRKGTIEVMQQLFGDMVMDETRYGFLTNFNQTVFVRRADTAGVKTLEVSPVVCIHEAPVVQFLYVLRLVEEDMLVKRCLSRILVPITPEKGDMLNLTGSQGKRKRDISFDVMVSRKCPRTEGASVDVYHSQQLMEIQLHTLDAVPAYDMKDVGICGEAVGLGKYGTVLAGLVGNERAALKCFDMRYSLAAEIFVNEVKVYAHLAALQGVVIPKLLLIGRIPHCNVYYIALSHEGTEVVFEQGPPACEAVRRQLMSALKLIHRAGVAHGDIRASHILWHDGPKFIDFDSAALSCSKREQEYDLEELQKLLDGD